MTTEFWLGIFISIPVGILTGIATPWFQKIFDKWSESKVLKTKNSAKTEYEKIKFYHDNRQELSQYLLSVVLKTTFIGAFLGIFSESVFTFAQLMTATSGKNAIFVDSLYAVGQFLTLVGSLLIVNMCRPALNVWAKIRDFSRYEKTLREKGIIL